MLTMKAFVSVLLASSMMIFASSAQAGWFDWWPWGGESEEGSAGGVEVSEEMVVAEDGTAFSMDEATKMLSNAMDKVHEELASGKYSDATLAQIQQLDAMLAQWEGMPGVGAMKEYSDKLLGAYKQWANGGSLDAMKKHYQQVKGMIDSAHQLMDGMPGQDLISPNM